MFLSRDLAFIIAGFVGHILPVFATFEVGVDCTGIVLVMIVG